MRDMNEILHDRMSIDAAAANGPSQIAISCIRL
jgi:hypothetical protein